MTTTSITIRGERTTEATISRVGNLITIKVENMKAVELDASTPNHSGQVYEAAKNLQYDLDGYVGTGGDQEVYRRVIESFLD